jgi:hypothetical protein
LAGYRPGAGTLSSSIGAGFPGAFLVRLRGFEGFKAAARRKNIREIAARSAAGR